MRKVLIAPSLLAANKDLLEQEVALAVTSGADWLHFDVMDAKFVPNTALTVTELRRVNAVTNLFLDVHLMIENPLQHVYHYIEAGADLITFHLEAMEDESLVYTLIDLLRSKGIKVGLSVKPLTSIASVLPYLPYLDLVLVMGVEPGKGGQKFIENSFDKIQYLRQQIDTNKYACLIEIDGGINDKTAKLCKQAGVDVLVAGSYLFGHLDFKKRLESLR